MHQSIMAKATANPQCITKKITVVKALSPKQASLLLQKDIINKQQLTTTPFQVKVYAALCRVPKGRVTTYKHLAASIACGSSQAVGQALRRNPYAPRVPCHRVVKSDRSIGGFFGATSGEKIREKIQLLQSEGVTFGESGKVDPTCIYTFCEN